jgi:predicted ester cyclase
MRFIKRFFKLLAITSVLFFSLSITAQENESKLESLWQTLKSEGSELLEKSIDITSEFLKSTNAMLDAELSLLQKLQTEPSDVDIRDKIDTIKIYVQDVSALKKQEVNASSFTLLSKSKKDYRIEIDEVLKEIEPILFDGEVVDYSSKIRDARQQIFELKEQKVALNEELFFAPVEATILKSSKKDIQNDIANIDRILSKSETLINELEFDLKKKMSTLGIEVTREQVRVMTTRVDGDELARSFAIFDVTRQISNTLGKLVQKNSFSAQTTVKYYGTYVILSEILGYSQREYIRKIEDVYLPAIATIEDDIENAINFARDSINNASLQRNQQILKNNIRSNEYSLEVVRSYRSILEKQIESLEDALEKTHEQIMVSYSTYDTATNSANLVNLISETQESFDRIMNMQIPDIIPFENTELELKFQEISDQIISTTGV